MKSRFFVVSACVAISMLPFVAPETACAQGNTWVGTSLAQMVDAARWRWGDLRINAALELANAGYDSDIYFGYLEEPVHDYTFSVGIPVQVLFPLSKKVVLDIFDSPQYSFYLDTKRERAWNNMFRGQVHFALDRFYIRAGGGLANIRQRLSPELNVNVRQKEDSLDGLVLWQISRETSLALQYGGATFDYGDASFGEVSISDALNRKENFFDFIAYVQPTSRVRFYADGQYGRYAFAETVSSFKDTRSYGLYGGIEFIPRAGRQRGIEGVQGSINLGYMRFDVIDAQQIDGSGLVGEATVSAGLMRRTTGQAFFSREFQFSAYSDASYYISTSIGAGITRLLSRNTSVSYSLSFGRSLYPEGEPDGGGIPQGISNRYTTHMFNLNLRLARNLEITFLGTIGRRILSENAQARERNFFGVNLLYGVRAGEISTPMSRITR